TRSRVHVLRPRVLARAAARPLARHDHTADEQLAAPDAPGLLALQRAGEALLAERALQAQGLGELDVGGSLGEAQLRVGPARKSEVLLAYCESPLHHSHPCSSRWISTGVSVGLPGQRRGPRIRVRIRGLGACRPVR